MSQKQEEATIEGKDCNVSKAKIEIKPSLKRFLVLFFFCLNYANKSFQWIQLSASTKKLSFYYGVENYVINGTSVIFLIWYLFLSCPTCYLIKLIGLRNAVLIGSAGTAIGSLIKCFSCEPEHGIYSLFVGQIFVSLSEQFVFSLPSRIASVWFPDNQVSTAVALCIMSQELGVASAFVIPQIVLEEAERKEEIGVGLYKIFLWTAIISFAALIGDLFLFDEAPEFAPGKARLKQKMEEKQENRCNYMDDLRVMCKQMKDLMKDKDFNVLALSFGINVGIGYTILTLLNQTLEPLYPGEDIFIGITGLIIILSAVIGSVIWGRILDLFHLYLLTNILLTLSTIISLLVFIYVLYAIQSALAIYIAAALLGFFQTGFVVAGLELTVELTYPIPELVSSSLMNISPQVVGSITTFAGSYIVDTHGAIALNIFYLILTALALILLLNVKENLKRQKAAAAAEANGGEN